MKSRYVALEGIEGAGKSSVARVLASRLREDGLAVDLVREPGGTEVGEQIRIQVLSHGYDLSPWTEALLFAAARAQLAAECVAPALHAGRWVVSDRSVYSSLAYQGGGRDLGVDAVRAVNIAGLGSVWPDLVVLLRVDVETGLARQAVVDRIGAEGLDFLRRVAKTFDELAAAERDRFAVVDAGGGIDEVARRTYEEVRSRW